MRINKRINKGEYYFMQFNAKFTIVEGIFKMLT